MGNSDQIPNSVQRIANIVLGISRERLDKCPPDDHYFINRIFLHIILTFLLIFFSSYLALSVALSSYNSFSSHIGALFTALLIALLVIFIDIYIIQSTWYDSGKRELEQAIPQHPLKRSKRDSFRLIYTFRLLISIFVSLTIAAFVDMIIFNQEIQKVIDEKYESVNQSAFSQSRQDVQEIIDAQSEKIERLRQELNSLQESPGQETSITESVRQFNREIEDLGQQEAELLDERQRLSDKRAEARRKANAESEGVEIDGTTGERGRGPRYRFWSEEARRLQQQIQPIDRRLQDIRSDVQSRTEQRDRLLQREDREARDNRLERLAQRRNEISQQISQEEVRYQEMINNRVQSEARRREQLRSEGVIPPKDEGLLARFIAFKEFLERNPIAWFPFVIITVLVLLLELSAVISKLFFSPNTQYALRVAKEYDDARYNLAISNEQISDLELRYAQLEAKLADAEERIRKLRKP